MRQQLRQGALIAPLLAGVTLMGACSHRPTSRSTAPTTSPPSTQRPYTVKGKQYTPLPSHHGYEEEGLASSYGREFHGRSTSSGETFDMHAMTAAHKTLPLGVYVRVRHKRSGKEVVVRINDRGPFVGDRIIDLSEASAIRLGMLQEGVAPVLVTALGFKTGHAAGDGFRAPASYDSGRFGIQVGAFTNESNARAFAGQLRSAYGNADIQAATVRGQRYYRVRLGAFTSLSEAVRAQQDLQRTAFPGTFVVAID